jgi:hypothetical protein
MKDIQPESPGLDLREQIAVRGGNHFRVDNEIPVSANAPVPALLKYIQQLRLQHQIQLADFIEKNSPSLGLLEEPRALHYVEDCGHGSHRAGGIAYAGN